MSRLTALMARGTAFLGSEVAIMAGAMSWISERHLVSAMSNAGGFGVIAGGAMPPCKDSPSVNLLSLIHPCAAEESTVHGYLGL